MSTRPTDTPEIGTDALKEAARGLATSDPLGQPWRDAMAYRVAGFVPRHAGVGLPDLFARPPGTGGPLTGFGGPVIDGMFGSCFPAGATGSSFPDWASGGCFPGSQSGTGMTDLLSKAGGLMAGLPGMLMDSLWKLDAKASAGEVAANAIAKKLMGQLQAAGFDPAAIEQKLDKLFNGISSPADVPVALGDIKSTVVINGDFYAVRLGDKAVFVQPVDAGTVIEGNPTVLAGDAAVAGKGFLCQGMKGTVGGIFLVSPNVLIGSSSVIIPNAKPNEDAPADDVSPPDGAAADGGDTPGDGNQAAGEATGEAEGPAKPSKPAQPDTAGEADPEIGAPGETSKAEDGPHQCGPDPPERGPGAGTGEPEKPGPEIRNPDSRPSIMPWERDLMRRVTAGMKEDMDAALAGGKITQEQYDDFARRASEIEQEMATAERAEAAARQNTPPVRDEGRVGQIGPSDEQLLDIISTFYPGRWAAAKVATKATPAVKAGAKWGWKWVSKQWKVGKAKASQAWAKVFPKSALKGLTSFDDVSNYLRKNGKLPNNYITKDQAKKLGWDPKKGNLDQVAPGKSIGGDIFKNKGSPRPLPDAPGRVWREADINYSGGFRGGERIVYSSDGLIYRTADHYGTFTRIK